MIIKNITINSFGKLNNYSLDLKGGVNAVYGPNEYGKTTIMEFIKIMFYGRNEKIATDKFVREKYKPWDGSKMSGSITFEHDGQIYKIQKEISDKSAKSDKTIIHNMSVGNIINLGKNEEVGERFLGIDVKSFERSSYIKNIGAVDFENTKSSKNSKDTLADKMLSNLLETGDEDVSQSGVIGKIKAAMNDLKTPTGRSGKIRKLENEISDLKFKINDINNFEKSQEGVKRELENLSALMKEQETLESKIKKADEYKRIKQVEKLLEKTYKKEKIREKALEFGIDFEISDEVFGIFRNYRKSLGEIDAEIENIKKISENKGNKFPKISEEEKNRFEILTKKFECEKQKNEILKYLTAESFPSHECDQFDFPEVLKNISSKLENLERLKSSKKIEIEKNHSKFKKTNKNFFFFDGLFLACSVISMLLNFLGLFPFAFGLFLCVSAVHLFYFYNSKKEIKILENEISVKDCETENLKSRFNIEIEKIKSETENNLKNAKESITNLLAEKMSRNTSEFYENYAKSQKSKDFEAVLNSSTNKRSKILGDIKRFLNVNGLKIEINNFSETLDYLSELNLEYTNLVNEIKYQASSINLKNADLKNLKNILKENPCPESFKIDNIDAACLRLDELKKMNLNDAYINTQKKIINMPEDPKELELSLEKLNLKKQKMEEYCECLKVSLEAFEEVSDDLRKNFNPKLSGRASEIFQKLTGGKYENLYIQKDYDFVVGGEITDRYSRYFSSGTIDQAYLAARVAISELVSDVKIPLVFDDTLMQYDDERLKNAVEFLKSYTRTNGIQCIVFTCHDYLEKLITGTNDNNSERNRLIL